MAIDCLRPRLSLGFPPHYRISDCKKWTCCKVNQANYPDVGILYIKIMEHRWTESLINTIDKNVTNDTKEKWALALLWQDDTRRPQPYEQPHTFYILTRPDDQFPSNVTTEARHTQKSASIAFGIKPNTVKCGMFVSRNTLNRAAIVPVSKEYPFNKLLFWT